MLEIIDSSDFDEWHKLILSQIINGYYVGAYENISYIICKQKIYENHVEW